MRVEHDKHGFVTYTTKFVTRYRREKGLVERHTMCIAYEK